MLAPRLAVGLGLLALACSGGEQTAPAQPPAHSTDQALAEGLEPAFGLVNDSRFDEARKRVARYLADGGANAYQAEFLLGYSYQKQKLYERAKGHLLRAIDLAPDYHASYHFLGYAHYYLGELDDARLAFEAHLRFQPDEGDNHFGIGICDLDQARLDAAEQRFRRAIELNTEVSTRGRDRRREIAKCRARLGDVLELRGDHAGARLEYEQAVRTWPAHTDVWHKLHRVLLRLGEDELAAAALKQLDFRDARAQSVDARPP